MRQEYIARVWGSLVLATVLAARVWAQDLAVSTHAEVPPPDLAPPVVAALVSSGGTRVSLGQTTLDFWWVTKIKSGPGHPSATGSWRQVPEGALIGVLRVSGSFRDVRGRAVKTGVYTLRLGIQPADGDHLGVSPFREFLLLSPAAVDRDAAPTGYQRTVDTSRRAIGGAHPAVLSIAPPESSEAAGAVVSREGGHTAVVVEVGQGAEALRFCLILVGTIQA